MHVPGHDRHLDPRRVLVTTTHFRRFQEALKTRFPALMLAMDREDGLWCIVRRDPYRRRVRLNLDGVHLTHFCDVYTPIMHLEYVKNLPDGDHARIFLRPGEWVFRALARMHPAHLGFDNTQQMRKDMIAKDKRRRQELKRLSDRMIDDGVQDWAKHVSRLEPTKWKPSVLVAAP